MVLVVEDAGGISAGGSPFPTMLPRVLSKRCMAPIMSLGLPEVDGELDYTIHGLSGHHTLAEMPAKLTESENRQPASVHRLLISPSRTTGAANARAGKVVRANVSPDFGDVTHWRKE